MWEGAGGGGRSGQCVGDCASGDIRKPTCLNEGSEDGTRCHVMSEVSITTW